MLRWQRERCGTVEKVHDVLKNDLAGRVMPAKRFFANAAWWRLNTLAYNILSVMKRKSLPSSWWSVRLKALRYHLLCIAGRVINHGRSLFLKIVPYHPSFHLYKEQEKSYSFFLAPDPSLPSQSLHPMRNDYSRRDNCFWNFKSCSFSLPLPNFRRLPHPLGRDTPSSTSSFPKVFTSIKILITDYGQPAWHCLWM